MIALVLVAVVLVVAVAAFVAYPLIRPSRWSSPTMVGASADLLRRRDRLYAELRELEFDRRVGKVTEEDYLEARQQLETEAARVLRAIDVGTRAIDEEIEREVRRLREDRRTCPSCGAVVVPAARFCASCGEPLQAVAPR